MVYGLYLRLLRPVAIEQVKYPWLLCLVSMVTLPDLSCGLIKHGATDYHIESNTGVPGIGVASFTSLRLTFRYHTSGYY